MIREGEQAIFLRRNPGRPLVVLAFGEGQGQTAANTGASSESHSTATLTSKWPRWSTNSPRTGDGWALDGGTSFGSCHPSVRKFDRLAASTESNGLRQWPWGSVNYDYENLMPVVIETLDQALATISALCPDTAALLRRDGYGQCSQSS